MDLSPMDQRTFSRFPLNSRPFGVTIHERLFAEFLGTFVLIFVGLSPTVGEKLEVKSTNAVIEAISWWFAVLMATLLTDRISGAHLNPSVSLSMYICNKLGWFPLPTPFTLLHLVLYFISQLFGAFMASLFVFILYFNVLHKANEQNYETSRVFVTWPANDSVSNWQACLVEILGTMLLLLSIWGIIEPSNGISNNIIPKCGIIGACVFVITAAFSCIAGPALNPARDLGPRLFCWLLHWGDDMFTKHNYYFWIPLIMPPIGGILGSLLYHLTLKKSIYKVLRFNKEQKDLYSTIITSSQQAAINNSSMVWQNNTNLYDTNDENASNSVKNNNNDNNNNNIISKNLNENNNEAGMNASEYNTIDSFENINENNQTSHKDDDIVYPSMQPDNVARIKHKRKKKRKGEERSEISSKDNRLDSLLVAIS